jgi:hypothetical protein
MRPEQVILASQIAEAHALRRRSWETYFATPDLAPEQATALRSEWSTQADTVRHGIGAMRTLDPDGGLPAFDPVDVLERARRRALDGEREAAEAAARAARPALPAPSVDASTGTEFATDH